MTILSKEYTCYLAGLIDGEGCINSHITKHGFVTGQLIICMTDIKPLIWCKNITRIGNIYKRKKQINRKISYVWVCNDINKSAMILKQLIPFLKVKREEAQAFLILRSLKNTKIKCRTQYKKAEILTSKIITLIKQRNLD